MTEAFRSRRLMRLAGSVDHAVRTSARVPKAAPNAPPNAPLTGPLKASIANAGAAQGEASSPPEHQPPQDLIELGRLGTAFGLDGSLRFYAEHDSVIRRIKWIWLERATSSLKAATAQANARVEPRAAGASSTGAKAPRPDALHRFRVEKLASDAKGWRLRLAGIEDRNLALTWARSTVWASRADFPKLAEDEWYWSDLIGLQVAFVDDDRRAHVVAVHDQKFQKLLEIETATGARDWVPAVNRHLIEVDLKEGRVVLDWDLDWQAPAPAKLGAAAARKPKSSSEPGGEV